MARILKKFFFLVLTFIIIGDMCFGVYTWLEGSRIFSVFMGFVPGIFSLLAPIGIVSLWFTLYCLSMRKTTEKGVSHHGDQRTLAFTLPLVSLITNIMLGILFTIMEMDSFWIGDEIPTKIIILLIIFLWMVSLLYFSKQNNVMIWCPVSFYTTICSGFLGIYIVTVGIILVFSVIEYIITLILNRRLWRVPKSNMM